MKSIMFPTGVKEPQREPSSSSPSYPFGASPIAARRATLEQRRRPAARFMEGFSPGSTRRTKEPSDDEEDGQDSDESDDVDSPGEQSPLLPIFSAEHLGLQAMVDVRCFESSRIESSLVSRLRKLDGPFCNAEDILIDALSYDFYPLQGMASDDGPMTPGPNWDQSQKAKTHPRAARISTLEVAIRAQAKRFLAHPLVVQQLEAIWAGNIVFHHSADTLHRAPVKVTPNQNRGYGKFRSGAPTLQASEDHLQPAKQREHRPPTAFAVRRSVTLYDPRQASLFKLSRLRVPRYRQFLSTCSFAILLGLYLAVLIERSLSISALEVLFWIWSAGFLLDEVVGFNEQGFSLYIMSFWNTFDLGILFLLVCYYCLRLYGIIMPDGRKNEIADLGYDFLAANGVLLFPRLFSVLDHYRYFSQLLIAFRMMAMNLVAVFILIIISCSGFFVAFTLSFGTGDGYDAPSVAYILFQILMGFTPGETTFAASHQFLLAVNTISMVKSDALFSYVAPTNVIAWLLTPLRYLLPFRQYVRINRTVIKATHFPILFVIYAYERTILRGTLFEGMDLVQDRGRSKPSNKTFDSATGGLHIFSPRQGRVREASVATFHKDKALEEVFRRPFKDETIRETQRSQKPRNNSNVVSHWMSSMDPNGTVHPPMEQDQRILDRLEARDVVHRRSQLAMRRRQGESTRDLTEAATISVVSDPEEFLARGSSRSFLLPGRQTSGVPRAPVADVMETEADGDDELVTNEEEDLITLDPRSSSRPGIDRRATLRQDGGSDLPERPATPTRVTRFFSPVTPSNYVQSSSPQTSALNSKKGTPPRQIRHHSRMPSTTTVVYDPPAQRTSSSSSSTRRKMPFKSGRATGVATPNRLSTSSGRHTPKHIGKAIPRPIMPPRTAFHSVPDLAGMLSLPKHGRGHRRSSLTAFELGSDIGDNKAIEGGFMNTGVVPASFATQLEYAKAGMKARRAAQKQEEQEDQDRISKLVLARMNSLEEGFREIIKEVQGLRSGEQGRF
ncbi:uncharacterized protein KY384_007692 [Bacidia gigantensis]|uniref:uncharacterized protein n=1 Tax=Bacidia gigantensis TaxID=2732470 RepID=UPI001D04D4EE|nr:uncharacterized protein KY384_007692 [Bacidia gigantensis]KAG8527540.1 hypothetical protein KY384_007692 [Bacidia gigantensis]